MALTRSQWIEPSRSPAAMQLVFNNLPAFCFYTKVYMIRDGKKRSHSSYDFGNFISQVNQYYWTYYSKGHDRLYTLVYMNTGEYVFCKSKGVMGYNGDKKKLHIYVSLDLEDLLRTAFTDSEYNRYKNGESV